MINYVNEEKKAIINWWAKETYKEDKWEWVCRMHKTQIRDLQKWLKSVHFNSCCQWDLPCCRLSTVTAWTINLSLWWQHFARWTFSTKWTSLLLNCFVSEKVSLRTSLLDKSATNFSAFFVYILWQYLNPASSPQKKFK